MIKNYFKLLYLGFTQPSSYKKWLVIPRKHITRFFAVSMLLVGLIQGIIVATKHLPELTTNLLEAQDKLINQYPEDLIISWESEKLSLQPTEKYQSIDLNLKNIDAFSIEEELYIYYRENQISDEEKQNLLNNEQTMFVINDQKIQFKTEEDEVFATELKNILETEDFVITKQDLPSIKDEVTKGINEWLPKLQLAIPFVSALLSLLFAFIASIIFTVFLWLLLQITPLTIKKWRHAWRLTLAVMVTVSYLELIIQVIYPQNHTPIRELAFWLITGYVLLTWKFPKFKILNQG